MEEEEHRQSSETLIIAGENDGGSGADEDLQTIRDVLSVHHVPVVASLHWNKLHSILHSLCDRIATQALRIEKAEQQGKNFLEKAEEQGKSFLTFKDELDQLCRNAVKEMKEARESELQQQQNWSKMVEERLQSLQEGVDANNSSMKQLGDDVAELHNLDARVQSFVTQLDALQETSKNFDRLDVLEEANKNLGAVQASHTLSLESLNQRVEELAVDFEEQNDKLHTLEEQHEQLKLRLEQTIKSHASDLESLQQYCRNLRSDFELKFLVDVGKAQAPVQDELSTSSKAKLEAAVAELQNRMAQKADVDESQKIAQSTQTLKDEFSKMESNMVEVQSQIKRLSAGSRRASRVSLTAPIPLQMLLPEAKIASLEGLGPKLMEEWNRDVKEAIENHEQQLAKVQKDFSLLGRGILILSGHHEEKLKNAQTINSPEKIVKLLEGLEDGVPKSLPGSSDGQKHPMTVPEKALPFSQSHVLKSVSDVAVRDTSPEVSLLSTASQSQVLQTRVDQMDDDAIVQAIDDALKLNKFEPKESSKTISRISQDLVKIMSMINDLDAALPSLKDGLSLKADKRDLQRLARYVKEHVDKPENVLFTGKPLFGYKCVSCDHPVDKLRPVTGEHVPTNRMPPQILPMLSAERIYSLDRRPSTGSAIPPQPSVQPNKSWNGALPCAGSGITDMASNGSVRRSHRIPSLRKASSPRKAAVQ